LNVRITLRNEFLFLGLHDYLPKLSAITDESVQTQIKYFEEAETEDLDLAADTAMKKEDFQDIKNAFNNLDNSIVETDTKHWLHQMILELFLMTKDRKNRYRIPHIVN
jgi:hypothetical protein